MLVLLIFLISGCTTDSSDVQDAIRVGEDFKKIVFNIPDYSTFSTDRIFPDNEKVNQMVEPLLTDEEYKRFVNRVEYRHIAELASRSKVNISLANIEFTKIKEEKDFLDFDYLMTLRFNSTEKSMTRELGIKGEMALIKDEGKWKISRDWNRALTTREIDALFK